MSPESPIGRSIWRAGPRGPEGLPELLGFVGCHSPPQPVRGARAPSPGHAPEAPRDSGLWGVSAAVLTGTPREGGGYRTRTLPRPPSPWAAYMACLVAAARKAGSAGLGHLSPDRSWLDLDELCPGHHSESPWGLQACSVARHGRHPSASGPGPAASLHCHFLWFGC